MKDIPGFTDYCITKDGQVWSKPRVDLRGHKRKEKWLRPGTNTTGRLFVLLRNSGKKYSLQIHRLVLETFVGPCPKGMEGRHLDGNSSNNNLKNLKWRTHSENMLDAVKHGTAPGLKSIGENNGRSKLTTKDVRMIVYMYRTKLFTQREIAEIYNVSRTTVYHIMTRKKWKHIWAEKENLEI